MGLTILSLLIVVLMGLSLGAIFSIWIGGLAMGLLFLLTWPLERWLSLSLQLGQLRLLWLGPVVWMATGGLYLYTLFGTPALQQRRTNVAFKPMTQDVVATPNVIFPKQSSGVLRVEKDTFTYELTLRYRKGVKLQIPKITAHPIFNGPFVMPADKPPKIRFHKSKDGIETKEWVITLVPVSTGPLHTPRFVIRYLKDGKWKKIVVARIAVDVSELGKPQQLLASLREMKPPTLPERPADQIPWLWISIFATLLIVSLGGSMLLRYQQQHAAPALPPHEWFEVEFDALNKQKLLKKQMFKVHYYALSEIFRGYLERRYTFPALESTTEEIIQWSKEHDMLEQDIYRDVRKSLQWMDSIKFAGHQPTDDEMGELEKRLHSIVRRTRQTAEELKKAEEQQREAKGES